MQLDKILGTKNNIKVIRHLVKHKDWEFNITELAKDTGLNKGVLSRLVRNLEQENIIKVKRKGKILLFSINKENFIMKNLIMPLFQKEDTIVLDHMKTETKKIVDKNIISLILYGSFASGTAKLTSDIDIMVIVNKKSDILNKKFDGLEEKFLKEDLLLRVDILTLSEFKKLYKQKEPLIKSIIKNHKIMYGGEMDRIIQF